MLPRRIACAFLVLAVCLFGGWRHADAGPELFAGGTLPMGNFGDAWKAGWHVGADYTVPVTPMSGVGVLAAYHRLTPDLTDVTGHANLVEVLAIAKLTPPVGFFVMGGVGFTHSKFSSQMLDVAIESSSTDLTLAGGIGFSLTVLRVSALYHNVRTSGSSSSFVTVSAGLGF